MFSSRIIWFHLQFQKIRFDRRRSKYMETSMISIRSHSKSMSSTHSHDFSISIYFPHFFFQREMKLNSNFMSCLTLTFSLCKLIDVNSEFSLEFKTKKKTYEPIWWTDEENIAFVDFYFSLSYYFIYESIVVGNR